MKKAISPLMATVILLALTLAVGGILGSWFVSMSKSEISGVGEKMTELTNCTGVLDIVTVTCNSTAPPSLRLVVHNMASDLSLYDFSILAFINNTAYINSTGGPDSGSPLGAGQQSILTYGCPKCVVNVTIGKIRVTPGNCVKGWLEIDAGETCRPL